MQIWQESTPRLVMRVRNVVAAYGAFTGYLTDSGHRRKFFSLCLKQPCFIPVADARCNQSLANLATKVDSNES
jgi:hypothetical protein